jgi:hypothetical protein
MSDNLERKRQKAGVRAIIGGAWSREVKYGVGSPKFIWAPVYSCTHWLRSRNSPPLPLLWFIYEGAIGQPTNTTSLCIL